MTDGATRAVSWKKHGRPFLGHPPCCNGAHLLDGTQADNVQDMITRGRKRSAFGEAHPRAKLRETDVIEIKRRYPDRVSTAALAREFGIAHKTLTTIVSGKIWKHVGQPDVR